jgi:hypothetical protein
MNKFSSIFGQILQIFSKAEFSSAVMETKAERKAKGFTCWEQFVAMFFYQKGSNGFQKNSQIKCVLTIWRVSATHIRARKSIAGQI